MPYCDLFGARDIGEMRRRLRHAMRPKAKRYKGSKAAKKASRRRCA